MKPLLAALIAALAFVARANAQPVPDHLKCYKVNDPQAKTKYTTDLSGLVAEPGCTIKVPAIMACVPATKTNVMPPPPGGGGTGTPDSFFCYKVRCPKVALPTLTGTDQFGSRTVTPSAAKLLCAPLAGPSTGCPLPATGQTTCWDGSGTVIPCTGTGQDGDTLKGAPLAYTDNGDGTITDGNTGLMWEKQSSDGSIHDMSNVYTWDQAFSGHVATLNSMSFAGHADWRVPNYKELVSIVNLQNYGPAVSAGFNTNCTSCGSSGCDPTCTVLTCSCTAFTFYWSASSWAPFPMRAWFVRFGDGTVNVFGKSGTFAVRAVRGGS